MFLNEREVRAQNILWIWIAIAAVAVCGRTRGFAPPVHLAAC
jgi:hypothetical protein